MAFLKALTVFIVCISIFGVIISKSPTVRNKNNSKNYNVLVTGDLRCSPCSGPYRAIVNLDERYVDQWYYVNCNDTFYIQKYLETPHEEDYKATFALTCGSKFVKVPNKSPIYAKVVGQTWVYDFGYIDLIFTKERKYRQRRNSFRKNNF